MTDAAALDLGHLRTWIGRTENARDVISPRLVNELHVTLDHEGAAPGMGEAAPLTVHWCLAPPAVGTSALGPDGHPPRGGFLPRVPLPRRMWAGGELRFEDRLRVGDAVERRSRIADVTIKRGRSGTLCFVAVDHEFHTARGRAIVERHDIVYRSQPMSVSAPVAPPATPLLSAAADSGGEKHDRRAGAVLLFRYSALTFNGHRIHYDRSYAMDEEGYPGLVVHGPLQATLLLERAAAERGAAPRSFSFRGRSPLFDFMPFRLCARDAAEGMTLWIETGSGRAMEAMAGW